MAEEKLLDHSPDKMKSVLDEGDCAIRGFRKAISLGPKNPSVYLEAGNFAYMMHSFCCRLFRHNPDLTIEQFELIEKHKARYLK